MGGAVLRDHLLLLSQSQAARGHKAQTTTPSISGSPTCVYTVCYTVLASIVGNENTKHVAHMQQDGTSYCFTHCSVLETPWFHLFASFVTANQGSVSYIIIALTMLILCMAFLFDLLT